MKLPCDSKEDKSVYDNQTMIDTQASEKGFSPKKPRTAIG